MNLFGRGAAILLLTMAVLASLGCVQAPPQASAPGGQVIPIPIPGSYIGNNSITDLQLAPNAIITNVTTNSTTTIGSATMVNATSPGSSVLNRTSSAVQVTFSAQGFTNGSSYMHLMIDNVEQAPGTVFMGNGSSNLKNNMIATSYTWYNGSLGAGTHWFNVQANVTTLPSGDPGNVTIVNATLFGVAYPK